MGTRTLPNLRSPLSSPTPPASSPLRNHRWRISPFPSSTRPSRPVRPIECAVRFRPCIDIHKGKVKQIVGSTLRDSTDDASLITNFESDKSPAEFASLYKQDGLTGGHVIMLGADAASQSAARQALRAYPGGLQVGGGINWENAMSYLEEGASHVIVTSYVFSDGQMDLERLKHLVHMIGKQRLILDLSCRKKVTYESYIWNIILNGKYAIVTDRWQKFSDMFLDEQTLEFLATYADEFLVHGVDVEGKRLGIDEELVALLGCHSLVCDTSSVHHVIIMFSIFIVGLCLENKTVCSLRSHQMH
ncbi:1-(5-phosphoribosyl)-5-[(5-phosphoribosylamino)methylideneamino] imidazole-4-carboxamide isomerase, chloroplastic isoform X3 [Elaeis guineensis]|uniref:1-(5-phosphoribosyl)-5-[(5-phosphoribosylamino)methylideneamino] imidazole-4-carboxamide isomerase HISN3, chloroplastic n=1 Tax=Elaeis guineensis var. tenera TaxID=51953 RepID=A0A6J0PG61_ELAGV|nr:1-(5-phosphoribosyl)-5-[(5-phosphoribosylamino)methylideneamino] imidazole-4-carboxamide isomerase, chloroplastic isoform X3 [Elaeis guineensis]